MDISHLDLNLLATLDVLLAERNVTRAAHRLNLSQPALSARLARLRDLFGDPLLIPAQRGMVITQLAAELQPRLHDALETVRRVLATGVSFEPAQAEATIAIAASDYVQSTVLLPLIQLLKVEAPKIRLAWRALELPSVATVMERGEVDLALMRPEIAPEAFHLRHIYHESYVLIARRGHPSVDGSVDLDLFCALEHIIVSPDGGGFVGPTDIALEAMGRSRRVALSAPGFLVVPDVVARSDMIAIVPARTVSDNDKRLQVLEPPIVIPGFDIAMTWHDRTTTHPMQRWLREKIASLGAQAGYV